MNAIKTWLIILFAWMLAPFTSGTEERYFLRNEDNTIDQLNRRMIDLTERMTAIQNKAAAESRAMDADELKACAEIHAEFESTQREIQQRENAIKMQAVVSAPSARISLPDDVVQQRNLEAAAGRQPTSPAAPAPAAGSVSIVDRTYGNHGFRNFGEFLSLTARAGRNNSMTDPRLLKNAATTYGNEGTGADGGFAVPPDFRSGIQKMLEAEAPLMGLCYEVPTESNQITFIDDPNPEYSTAGIYASWASEGGTLSQRKPNLKEVNVRLHKLSCLVPVTDELLSDASALASHVQLKAGEAMAWAISNAIINGTGVGQPLGILNSGGLVSVAAESGQTADTINFQNVQKGYYRLLPNSRTRAVVLANPDAEEQFPFLAFPTSGGTVATPVYLPNGGAAATPYSTMFGRRIIPSQACPVLGDVGDVIFADMSKYVLAVRRGGIRQDVSIHVYFEQDIQAFRFIMRIGGQPWRNSTVAAYQNGGNARGHFTAIATRS